MDGFVVQETNGTFSCFVLYRFALSNTKINGYVMRTTNSVVSHFDGERKKGTSLV